MTTSLIIFDFDGTLADTTATILQNYHWTIRELSLPDRTDRQLKATIGIPLREGFRQLYPDLTGAQLDHCVTVYRRIFTDHKKQFTPSLFPGVRETLRQLSSLGVQMAVASSRSRESLVEFCDVNDLTRFFSLIIGADDVAHPKPNPEPVLTILRRLKKQPEETIVVGDMPVDIAMGRGAGCRTIGVTYGNSSAEALARAGATFVITSFPQLLANL